MAQKYTVDNIIQSSRMYPFWTASSQELRTWTRDRVSQLLSENKPACHDIIFSRMANLFIVIAIHEYHLSKGMDPTESLDTIFSAMKQFMDPSRKNFSNFFSKKIAFKLSAPILSRAMTRGNGKGFYSTVVKVPGGMGFDTTECVYKTIMQDKYGYTEMSRRFCDIDEYMYGSIPNVKFDRKGTLCKGCDKCDFRFIYQKGINK